MEKSNEARKSLKQILMERAPDEYERVRKRISETRKKLIDDERRRILFGLAQKTKLRNIVKTMTKEAAQQKYNMIHKHNYFADKEHPTCVCYDSETDKEQCERYTIYKQGGWQHRYVMHGCIDRTLIRRKET